MNILHLLQENNDKNAIGNACRCCLNIGSSCNLWGEYIKDGEPVVYGDMLSKCFSVQLSKNVKEQICEKCVISLFDAYTFKMQVCHIEKQLSQFRMLAVPVNKSTLNKFQHKSNNYNNLKAKDVITLDEDIDTNNLDKENNMHPNKIYEDIDTNNLEKDVFRNDLDEYIDINYLDEDVDTNFLDEYIVTNKLFEYIVKNYLDKDTFINNLDADIVTNNLNEGITKNNMNIDDIDTNKIDEGIDTNNLDKGTATYNLVNNIETIYLDEDIDIKNIDEDIYINNIDKDIVTNDLDEDTDTKNLDKGIVTNNLDENIQTIYLNEGIDTNKIDEGLNTNNLDEGIITNNLNEYIDTICLDEDIDTNKIDKDIVTNNFDKDTDTNNLDEDIATNKLYEYIVKNYLDKDKVTNNLDADIATNNFNETIDSNDFDKDTDTNNFDKDLATYNLDENIETIYLDEDIDIKNINEDIDINKIDKDIVTNYLDEDTYTNNLDEGIATNNLDENIQTIYLNEGIDTNKIDESLNTNNLDEGIITNNLNEYIDTICLDDDIDTNNLEEGIASYNLVKNIETIYLDENIDIKNIDEDIHINNIDKDIVTNDLDEDTDTKNLDKGIVTNNLDKNRETIYLDESIGTYKIDEGLNTNNLDEDITTNNLAENIETIYLDEYIATNNLNEGITKNNLVQNLETIYLDEDIDTNKNYEDKTNKYNEDLTDVEYLEEEYDNINPQQDLFKLLQTIEERFNTVADFHRRVKENIQCCNKGITDCGSSFGGACKESQSNSIIFHKRIREGSKKTVKERFNSVADFHRRVKENIQRCNKGITDCGSSFGAACKESQSNSIISHGRIREGSKEAVKENFNTIAAFYRRVEENIKHCIKASTDSGSSLGEACHEKNKMFQNLTETLQDSESESETIIKWVSNERYNKENVFQLKLDKINKKVIASGKNREAIPKPILDTINKNLIQPGYNREAILNFILDNIQKKLIRPGYNNIMIVPCKKDTVKNKLNNVKEKLKKLVNILKRGEINLQQLSVIGNIPLDKLMKQIQLQFPEDFKNIMHLDEIKKTFTGQSFDFSKIDINDGSTDNNNMRVIKEVNKGYRPTYNKIIKAVLAVKHGMKFKTAFRVYNISPMIINKILNSKMELTEKNIQSILHYKKRPSPILKPVDLKGKTIKRRAKKESFNIPKSAIESHIRNNGILNQEIPKQRVLKSGAVLVTNVPNEIWGQKKTNFDPQQRLKFEENVYTILKLTNATPFTRDRYKYVCAYCDMTDDDPAAIRAHTAAGHAGDRLDRLHDLLRPAHRKETVSLDLHQLRCLPCDTRLAGPDQLYQHLQTQHDYLIEQAEKNLIVPYDLYLFRCICAVCGERAVNAFRLEVHMNTHYSNYICDDCGDTFFSSSQLKTHKKRKRLSRYVYECETCGETVVGGVKYREHQNSHYFRNKCSECGQRFQRSSQRDSHMIQQHPEMVPLIRCEDCGRQFRCRTAYRRHYTNLHMKVRDFQCCYCPRKYFINGQLKVHMKTHVGKKEYMCKRCNYIFPTITALAEHRKTHI